ncbi:alpha/beta hydrolase [Rhodococcoides yunnanense]|uniref:alpha/beta hydrolase n=1 Tax=Rhodococcoides yunnanense TaxID=278209 RepID=UPI00093397F5|nr:alpha/beta hydrolase-fold protein [Rhodococcus yunnanensis]
MGPWLRESALGVAHARIDGWLPVVVTVVAVVVVLGWFLSGRRRSVGVAAAVLVVLACATQINSHVVGYPTVAAALGHPPVVDPSDIESEASDVVGGRPLDAWWTPPVSMPPTGDVVEADIPGAVSGFHARPASIYLPPAYLSDPRAELPVLVLITGQPGHVVDWVQGGHLARTMDTFAAAHDGLAPVVVVADALGDTEANPMCMDSLLGNVFTYLSVDLPAWMRDNFQVSPDEGTWAIGGYSYGGTCALQTAVSAPQVFPTFLDISGEDEQRRGTRAESIAAAFGDDSPASERRFDDATPLAVLDRFDFADSSGAFVVGSDDAEFGPQTRRAFEAARGAEIDAHYLELPGGHSMDVWAPALETQMDWLGSRMGLTG